MTQEELTEFLTSLERGESLIESIVEAHGSDLVKAKAQADGRVLTDSEAEEIAAKRRLEFANSLRIREDGSLEGISMQRPLK